MKVKWLGRDGPRARREPGAHHLREPIRPVSLRISDFRLFSNIFGGDKRQPEISLEARRNLKILEMFGLYKTKSL